MNMKSIVGFLVVSTLVLGAVLYNSDEPVIESSDGPVQSYTLSNGMKVLVIENHRAPVVVSQVWYRVGASYEHDGITGVSHVLEHMMFKGTEKHPAGEFSKIIASNYSNTFEISPNKPRIKNNSNIIENLWWYI